jgi:hypothetical protein
MPTLGGMAQISRPFQIALIAVCLLAGVWFFALNGHSTSTSSSTPPAPSPVTVAHSVSPSTTAAAKATGSSAASSEKGAAPSTHIYHGPVPGLEGLTRDVSRAHKAVAKVHETPTAPAAKSTTAKPTTVAAKTTTATAKHSTATTNTSAPAAKTSAPAAKASTPTSTATAPKTVKQQPIKSQAGAGRTPAQQLLVERALKEGKVAVILFWNPKGAEDKVVSEELKLLEAIHHLIKPIAGEPRLRRALQHSGLELTKSFAAFQATAKQVTGYGTITRDIQIAQTPTVLIIDKQGKTIVLTGLQDAFSIEQAIDEARHL